MQHAFLQLGVIFGECSFSDNENDIQIAGNFRLVMTDNLFDQPSHPVADYSIPDLFADGYAHPESFHFSSGEPIYYILMIRK